MIAIKPNGYMFANHRDKTHQLPSSIPGFTKNPF
jgi:hypothetical protein